MHKREKQSAKLLTIFDINPLAYSIVSINRIKNPLSLYLGIILRKLFLINFELSKIKVLLL